MKIIVTILLIIIAICGLFYASFHGVEIPFFWKFTEQINIVYISLNTENLSGQKVPILGISAQGGGCHRIKTFRSIESIESNVMTINISGYRTDWSNSICTADIYFEYIKVKLDVNWLKSGKEERDLIIKLNGHNNAYKIFYNGSQISIREIQSKNVVMYSNVGSNNFNITKNLVMKL